MIVVPSAHLSASCSRTSRASGSSRNARTIGTDPPSRRARRKSTFSTARGIESSWVTSPSNRLRDDWARLARRLATRAALLLDSRPMTSILGLNAYHADVAAAEEERFNRIKHSAGFPIEAVRYCLRQGGLDVRDLDAIAIAAKPIENVKEEILQILSGRPAYSRQIQKRLQAVAQFRDVRAVLAREFGVRKDDLPKLEEIPHHLA